MAAVAAAPLLLAAPAQAQTAPAPTATAAQYLALGASAAYAFQDSSSGSALAQITRAQSGLSAPPASAPLVEPVPAAAPVATSPLLQKASFTTPGRSVLEPAIARAPARLAGPVRSEPSVFGTIALAVNHTALDARWRRAEYAPAPSDARWREAVRLAAALPEHQRLALVNRWVNHAIAFESDQQNYGVSDYWASARESLARGRGDCEDYAIAKMELLRAAGLPASSLYLIVAKDLVRHADHALLAVRLEDGYWILDNGADEVLPADAVADYRPVVTFSAGREWMHGYRRTPDFQVASAARLAPALGR